MTFSERLILLRKQKGFSQEQLGAEVGVTRQTVSKWELGETTPEMDKLIKLAELFGITLDELAGREEKEEAVRGDSRENVMMCGWHYHYEYKSKRTFLGVPLVHVNVGHGFYKAKGIIAVGGLARGVISIGAVSAGLISFGALSLGAISLGALSLGLLLSVGAISVGTVAVGGISVGIFAVGGCAFGIYAVGGCAIAEKIAAGGYASAPIAIGEHAKGQYLFSLREQLAPDVIRKAILEKFPETWNIVVEFFNSFS